MPAIHPQLERKTQTLVLRGDARMLVGRQAVEAARRGQQPLWYRGQAVPRPDQIGQEVRLHECYTVVSSYRLRENTLTPFSPARLESPMFAVSYDEFKQVYTVLKGLPEVETSLEQIVEHYTFGKRVVNLAQGAEVRYYLKNSDARSTLESLGRLLPWVKMESLPYLAVRFLVIEGRIKDAMGFPDEVPIQPLLLEPLLPYLSPLPTIEEYYYLPTGHRLI